MSQWRSIRRIVDANDPFLTRSEWLAAVAGGIAFALCLGAFYIGMLWLGGSS
jgi:hypothetical protein